MSLLPVVVETLDKKLEKLIANQQKPLITNCHNGDYKGNLLQIKHVSSKL